MSLLSAGLPSIQELWQDTIHPRLLPHVMNWAHSSLGETAMNVTDVTRMANDYQMVHNEFILPNLSKSLIHPMETMKMHKLIQIMERRLADPLNHPPLEIMVFGPSVVMGVQSYKHNWGQPGFIREPRGNTRLEFAWPARLEDVLNNVVFRGQSVVRVTNRAVGGTFSKTGMLTMEYRLFAGNEPVPDIVIHSYGNTDVLYEGGHETQLLIRQEFILAAQKLRCDVDGLPHVILYEDFLGYNNFGIQNLHVVMKNLRTVAQAADWYDVMAASYATAFRHSIMSGVGGTLPGRKPRFPKPSSHLPMLGWRLDIHPGMLYHSTAPWVLVFNILENLVNSCQDFSTMQGHKSSYDELDVNQIPAVTPDILLHDLPRL